MIISVFNQQDDLKIDEKSVDPIVHCVLSGEKKRTDEVCIYFVSTERISQLHKDFFNDFSTTDCISLPLDVEDHGTYSILGNIFVCPKTAMDFVLHKKKVHDCYYELTLYLVHALLHLLGYDDIEPSDRRIMKKKEGLYIKSLANNKILIK